MRDLTIKLHDMGMNTPYHQNPITPYHQNCTQAYLANVGAGIEEQGIPDSMALQTGFLQPCTGFPGLARMAWLFVCRQSGTECQPSTAVEFICIQSAELQADLGFAGSNAGS